MCLVSGEDLRVRRYDGLYPNKFSDKHMGDGAERELSLPKRIISAVSGPGLDSTSI